MDKIRFDPKITTGDIMKGGAYIVVLVVMAVMLANDVEGIEMSVHEHRKQPWHGTVGTRVTKVEAELGGLTKAVDRQTVILDGIHRELRLINRELGSIPNRK